VTMVQKRRYGLFVLAIALFLVAGAAIFVGFNNPLALAFAGLMIVASVRVVKASNVHGGTRHADVGLGNADPDGAKRPSPLAWTVGAGSAAAFGISFFYLHKDAVNGYHGIVPVYAFAASALVATVVWSYLAAKIR